MFRAICQTGGVAGFNQYADFVGENPTLDTVCDHILHLLEMDCDCRHMALGADLDGCDTLSAGFDGIQSYPALATRLLARGVTDEMVRNLFWNNAWRVMKQCCM
jgi:membrane dipeptidase